jgi:hypothetical protein
MTDQKESLFHPIEQSELISTAAKMDELDKKRQEHLRCMENDNNAVAEITQQLGHLKQKLDGMTSQFSTKDDKQTLQESYKVATQAAMEKSLGPVVYREKTFMIRQGVIDYITALPYIDRANAIRFLISKGYKESTAENLYRVIVKYLTSKGWIVGANKDLRKPGISDLKTSTPEEQENLLKAVKH